jgi:hypothetical protein
MVLVAVVTAEVKAFFVVVVDVGEIFDQAVKEFYFLNAEVVGVLGQTARFADELAS